MRPALADLGWWLLYCVGIPLPAIVLAFAVFVPRPARMQETEKRPVVPARPGR